MDDVGEGIFPCVAEERRPMQPNPLTLTAQITMVVVREVRDDDG
jgi:hypothetical protein